MSTLPGVSGGSVNMTSGKHETVGKLKPLSEYQRCPSLPLSSPGFELHYCNLQWLIGIIPPLANHADKHVRAVPADPTALSANITRDITPRQPTGFWHLFFFFGVLFLFGRKQTKTKLQKVKCQIIIQVQFPSRRPPKKLRSCRDLVWMKCSVTVNQVEGRVNGSCWLGHLEETPQEKKTLGLQPSNPPTPTHHKKKKCFFVFSRFLKTFSMFLKTWPHRTETNKCKTLFCLCY